MRPDDKLVGGNHGLARMGLGALGIVFGDIGTSPLYTFKTVLDLAHDGMAPQTVLGLLSLIVWTLIVITTIKYVLVAMRVDNDGEGGILALMSLLGVKRRARPAIVALGLFGAALIYGDGAITPAISVLSALEGLSIEAPTLHSYVLPITVAILIALFVIVWHVKHNRALHRRVLALTVVIEPVPRVADTERVTASPMGPEFWRALARFGFMERPDIPRLLVQIEGLGCPLDLADITYYVGHETLTPREDGKGLPRWLEGTFAAMERNAAHVTEFFNLPADQVVEIGRVISI